MVGGCQAEPKKTKKRKEKVRYDKLKVRAAGTGGGEGTRKARQEREGRRGGRRRKEEEGAGFHLKSNNPNQTGGEKAKHAENMCKSIGKSNKKKRWKMCKHV